MTAYDSSSFVFVTIDKHDIATFYSLILFAAPLFM